MDTEGRHLLCDIWLDQELGDTLVSKFTSVIDEILTVMNRSNYKFEPQGETIAYILAESHFTVHTYPEHRYLSLDIYICNPDIDLDGLLEKMLSGVKVKNIHTQTIARGIDRPSTKSGN